MTLCMVRNMTNNLPRITFAYDDYIDGDANADLDAHTILLLYV